MEFDPLSRDVAPPRHEIESDSEDEMETGPSTSSKRIFTPPQVQLVLNEEDGAAASTGSQLVIFQSEGAEAFLREQKYRLPEVGKLLVNEEQHGSLAMAGDTYIMLLRPSFSLLSDQASMVYICSSILSRLKPSKITIVDDYNPALYLSTKGIEEAPIRYLSKSQDAAKSGSQFGFELFETPNYVLGLAAAMMNECFLLGLPSATLLLLPRAINSHLQSWSRIQANSSSLDIQPDPLEADLASSLASYLPHLTASSPRFSTKADLQDFLYTRRSQFRKQVAQSVSAMYV